MNAGIGMAAGLAIVTLVGALLPIQAGTNGALARGVGAPMLATFWSLATSTVAVGIVLMLLRPSLPSLGQLARLPAWAWVGGLLGAIFVATATTFAPRLGAAFFTVAVVAGQLLSSLLLDSVGVLGYAQRSPSLGRIGGILLVVIGCLLVATSTTPAASSDAQAAEARG